MKNALNNSNMKNSFTIFHCNIRSLAKNFDNLYDILVSLTHIGVIAISETKLNSNSIVNLDLPNYIFLRSDSPKQAGGVGLYVHDSFTHKLRDDLELNINGCEDIWIEMLCDKNLICGVVYRHPNSDLLSFKEALLDKLEQISNENKHLIVIGDINIDLIKSNSYQFTSEYLDMIYSNYCFPVITQPTRITDHSQTLIDHIYINALEKNLLSGILMSDISDHFPVFLNVSDVTMKKSERSSRKRNLKSFNESNFF